MSGGIGFAGVSLAVCLSEMLDALDLSGKCGKSPLHAEQKQSNSKENKEKQTSFHIVEKVQNGHKATIVAS